MPNAAGVSLAPEVTVRRGVFMAVFLWISLACAGLQPTAPLNPGNDETIVFEVPKGATPKAIGGPLVDAGIFPSSLAWDVFLRTTDASCLKAGKFELRMSMSPNEVLETLCGAPLADDVPFTVLEGWRIRDVDAALVEKGWIEPGAYAAIANGKGVPAPFEVRSTTYEGYLWPETYMVNPDNFDAGQLIERQLATFQERFLAKHTDYGNRTLNEIVVMGSLLEREEPKPENRPLVAGILWKRIDRGIPLGVDATSRYTIEKWNDRRAFLAKLRDPSDPYNTRKKKGLPPTAIGAPTLTSLEAAMNPKSSPYLYYLHDADKNLHPARNGAEHEANRKKYNVY